MTKRLQISDADVTNQTPAFKRWRDGDRRYIIHKEIERAVEYCTSDERKTDAVNWRRDFRDFLSHHNWAVDRYYEANPAILAGYWEWDDVLQYWDDTMIAGAVEYYHNDQLICPVRAFAKGREVNAGELKGSKGSPDPNVPHIMLV